MSFSASKKNSSFSLALPGTLVVLFVLVFWFFLAGLVQPSSSQAAVCLGKPAKTISKSGIVRVKRNSAVMLLGKNVRVQADGDTRICSKKGNITLSFKKGNRNQAALGSGNNKVILKAKANQNRISLGNGNNKIEVRAQANQNIIRSGSGNDQILIAGKSNKTFIDTGHGSNRIIYAAKANSQEVRTGNGHDRILFRQPARANKRLIHAGLGNDRVEIKAKGHTTAFLSPKKNPRNLPDTDVYLGGPSNDTVFDYSGGTADNPNRIYGLNGSDKLHSYGNATSNLYGGNGTDWLYSASSGQSGDRLFGERGNDRLYANKGGANAKGAYLDGGEGDDWYYGTAGDDIIIALSGIKKIYAGSGNDQIIKTGNGIGTIDGGPGIDTISYIGHTPPGYWKYSGILVDLNKGEALNGKGIDKIKNIEHLIGSPFDDLLIGKNNSNNLIEGGFGNDDITAGKGSLIDGGFGENICQGGAEMINCNQQSPGEKNPNHIIVDIGSENILTVLGSEQSDEIKVGYDRLGGFYRVNANRYMVPSRRCTRTTRDSEIIYPAAFRELSTLTINGNKGNDSITVDYSVPPEVTTILNGGEGNNKILGGKTKDFITAKGSGRNLLYGRHGNDQIHLVGTNSLVHGGPGSDTLHIKETPCRGGTVNGGTGARDGLVFAGAPRGIYANLTQGIARWNKGTCASPVHIKNLDGLEGTKYNDSLIGNRRSRTSFLGREGIDYFNSKNGVKDSIITGPGGRKNKIVKDRFDRVVYGWGLAAY